MRAPPPCRWPSWPSCAPSCRPGRPCAPWRPWPSWASSCAPGGRPWPGLRRTRRPSLAVPCVSGRPPASPWRVPVSIRSPVHVVPRACVLSWCPWRAPATLRYPGVRTARPGAVRVPSLAVQGVATLRPGCQSANRKAMTGNRTRQPARRQPSMAVPSRRSIPETPPYSYLTVSTGSPVPVHDWSHVSVCRCSPHRTHTSWIVTPPPEPNTPGFSLSPPTSA